MRQAKQPIEPEEIAENDTVKRATELGWIVRKLTFPGVNGAPDRVFGKDRRTVAIEFKKVGKERRAQQRLRAQELTEAFGWEVHWTDNYEDACMILGIRP